ncbi:sirohydrochlorin ferrochelatase [Kitasatospora gansuensis]|uniref:Sirohydrochlorin ferrochelatase n=1 Tax=Kitasatospora gansuensis TaxID=258050 RepID=A0A7W7WJB2_9ACTN|nr:CbiX/SirB N-terminal domain-containing protein [Kitasatospora gansuensis]MBB4949156.1 sirohydrochlorin ferrochelatase [Kitasatospora gansuensis]
MTIFAPVLEPGPLPEAGRPTPPLVLAVRGSARPEAARAVDRLRASLTALAGAEPLVGRLDRRSPSLGEALAAAGQRAVVVPLLLGDGRHRSVDLPTAVAAATGLRAVVTPGLSGAAASLGLALYGRLREAEERAGGRADAVVLAAAGSTRPGGNQGASAAAARLRELLGDVPVVPAHCAATGPTVPAALAALRAEGYHRVAVATHLLAPGRFTDALADTAAWAVSAPLADHPLVARIVLRRYALGQLEPAGPGLSR